MMDFFVKDGKTYWASPVTKEQVEKEVESAKGRIQACSAQIEFSRREIERLQYDISDLVATVENGERFLKTLEATPT